MTPRRKIEILVYGLAVVLALVVLALAAASSSLDFDSRVVYQGF
jgi:hypothetical protein